jgi:hypothetical protein
MSGIIFGSGITLGGGIDVDAGGTPALIDGSALFNGSNYLSVAGGAGTAMGTGDFTWEGWVYPTSSADYQCFMDTRTNPLTGGDDTGFFFGTDFNALEPIYYTTNTQLVSTISMTLNAWNHVALTRNSGTVTLWVNGVSGGTQSNSSDLTQQRVLIGGDGLGTSLNLTGNISNLRIVKGTAVYTATFTPPTAPLTAISGTQLLLNTYYGANFLVDGSTNNFTVTNNGSVASNASNPFGGTAGVNNVIGYDEMPPPVTAGGDLEDPTATINSPTGFTINDDTKTGIAFNALTDSNKAFFATYGTGTKTVTWGAGSTVASSTVIVVTNNTSGTPQLVIDIQGQSGPATYNYPFTFS